MSKKIVAYKGFNRDWTCRGFKYEIGSTYHHEGDIIPCNSGFHACEHPLDVFAYYPPSESRFAVVEMSGETKSHYSDSKVAAETITVTAELKIHEMVSAAVSYVFDKATWLKTKTAEQDNGAASATGYQGAASATGDNGAASATGSWGAAMASGYEGKASGKEGCAIFLVEREHTGEIISVWAGISGRDGIKPDTFYTLKNGQPVEVK